jgi:hypothetical protein
MAYVILDGKIFSADRCSEKTTSVTGTQIDRQGAGKVVSTVQRRFRAPDSASIPLNLPTGPSR